MGILNKVLAASLLISGLGTTITILYAIYIVAVLGNVEALMANAPIIGSFIGVTLLLAMLAYITEGDN